MSKKILLIMLTVSVIGLSACNSDSGQDSGNLSATESSVVSEQESSLVSEQESSVVSEQESSVVSEKESSVVSEQESKPLSDGIAVEILKRAILDHYPDATFGETEILEPTHTMFSGGLCCKLSIKGNATVTDSYGYTKSSRFYYAALVMETDKGYYVGTSSGMYKDKRFADYELWPEEWNGYY